MMGKITQFSVLTVSAADKAAECLRDIIPPEILSEYSVAYSAGEARRILSSRSYDIIIINAPLADEYGTQLAVELSDDRFSVVILLTHLQEYEGACASAEPYGVLTVAKPVPRQTLFTVFRLAAATRCRLIAAEEKTASLKEKMNEIRLVNRAKWVLITHLAMSEEEAHRYIEKQAMDTRATRGDVAMNILNTYA